MKRKREKKRKKRKEKEKEKRKRRPLRAHGHGQNLESWGMAQAGQSKAGRKASEQPLLCKACRN